MEFDINSLSQEQRMQLAAVLTPFVGQNLVMTPTYFGDIARVHVGEGVVLANTFFNTSSGSVYIEDYVFFGHHASVIAGSHNINVVDSARQHAIPATGHDIYIDRGAWIASNASIVGPCRVGRHSIIAVGSVVVSDVQEGWLYGGVPAKPIKQVVKLADMT